MYDMVYKCKHCGAKVEEPIVREYKEKYEYWGATFTETYEELICPECGEDSEFEELYADAYDEDEEEEE